MADRPTRKSQTKYIEVPSVNMDGFKQPQALNMEVAVLGALMIDQNAYGMVAELLKPQSFYDHRHELIYKAIVELSAAQKPVDVMTVQEQLERTGELEEAGGLPYVLQINSQVSSSAHLVYHAQIIAQKSLARQLITFSSFVQTKAFDPTIDVQDLMQEAESQLFTLSQANVKKDYTQIDPIIGKVYDLIQEASKRDGNMSGLPTGFSELDKITNGWQKSDLIVIAARPAMGKTAFVISMIRRMAVDMRRPVAMFSLEMSNAQLVQRLMVNVTEIEAEKFRSGNLKPYEWNQLDAGIRPLYGAPIYIDDTPQLSVFELQSKARRLVKDHGVECIMIDYLQLMRASGMNINSRQEEVSSVSQALKGLAKELDIPIIALAQLNRGVESREGFEAKHPQLSDLRESGAIEQDADIVCMIHRPEYYKIYTDEKGRDWRGKAEFIIAKHRNGQVGTIVLEFKDKFARFSDLVERAASYSSPQLTDSEMASMGSNMQVPFAPEEAEDRPF